MGTPRPTQPPMPSVTNWQQWAIEESRRAQLQYALYAAGVAASVAKPELKNDR